MTKKRGRKESPLRLPAYKAGPGVTGAGPVALVGAFRVLFACVLLNPVIAGKSRGQKCFPHKALLCCNIS